MLMPSAFTNRTPRTNENTVSLDKSEEGLLRSCVHTSENTATLDKSEKGLIQAGVSKKDHEPLQISNKETNQQIVESGSEFPDQFARSSRYDETLSTMPEESMVSCSTINDSMLSDDHYSTSDEEF